MENMNTGRFERPDTNEAMRRRDETWQQILKEEEQAKWNKRKHRLLCWTGCIAASGVMLAMIQLGLIDQLIGEVFLVGIAAGFGFNAGK